MNRPGISFDTENYLPMAIFKSPGMEAFFFVNLPGGYCFEERGAPTAEE